jgi:phosphatidate cytidylyltransferase
MATTLSLTRQHLRYQLA